MWTLYSDKTSSGDLEDLLLRLKGRESRILFGAARLGDLRGELSDRLAGGARVAVISDRAVWEVMSPEVRDWLGGFPRWLMEPGESSKSWADLGQVLDFMAGERLDRQSILVALGGGVVGDLAGFAAAVYQRGIACWQIPTTLLAMVDSSVGGKTGINLKAGKNLVGSFHQPERVLIDPGLLKTLPQPEFAAGAAEILKYGLLGDVSLWRELVREPLERSSDPRLTGIIGHCCAMKTAAVEADEEERAKEGGRALLNLGHTFGHALEKVTAYGTYLHGEAVSVGLAAAARYSARQFGWDISAVEEVTTTLAAHHLPVVLREALPASDLLDAMRGDKKNRSGKIRLVLMEEPGHALTWSDSREDWILEIWKELGAS